MKLRTILLLSIGVIVFSGCGSTNGEQVLGESTAKMVEDESIALISSVSVEKMVEETNSSIVEGEDTEEQDDKIEDWRKQYKEFVDEIASTKKNVSFDLVFLEGDVLPKLCAVQKGEFFALYQYVDGNVVEYFSSELTDRYDVSYDQEKGYLEVHCHMQEGEKYSYYTVQQDKVVFDCTIWEETDGENIHFYYLDDKNEKSNEITDDETMIYYLLSSDFTVCFKKEKWDADQVKKEIESIQTKETYDSWQKAYTSYIEERHTEYPDCQYLLIYFDEDDIPELLVEESKTQSYLYTYRDQHAKICGSIWQSDEEGDYVYSEKANDLFVHVSSRIDPIWYYDFYHMNDEGMLEVYQSYRIQNEYNGGVGVDPATNCMDDNIHYYKKNHNTNELTEMSKEEFEQMLESQEAKENQKYIWEEKYSYSEMLEMMK